MNCAKISRVETAFFSTLGAFRQTGTRWGKQAREKFAWAMCSRTGLRYCMNSAALRFIPAEDLAKDGFGKYAKLFASK